jgi:hypothetical protein
MATYFSYPTYISSTVGLVRNQWHKLDLYTAGQAHTEQSDRTF